MPGTMHPMALGKRDELVGGGLERHLKFSGFNGYEAYDERVLGSGEFVEHIWREAELFHAGAEAPPPLDLIIERVATMSVSKRGLFLRGTVAIESRNLMLERLYAILPLGSSDAEELTYRSGGVFPRQVSWRLLGEEKVSESFRDC